MRRNRASWLHLLVTLFSLVILVAGCGQTTGEIEDDEDGLPSAAPDSKVVVSFETLALPLAEGSFAIVGIILDKPAKSDIKINLTLSSSRFDQLSDFEALPSSVTIPAGSLSKTIVLQAKEDTVFEGDEEFRLTLYTSAPNTKVNLNQLSLTVMENDSPPSVQFVAASSSSPESTATVDLEAQLSTATAVPVTVPYSVTGGTATASTDFTLASGTLTFSPGQTSQKISVAVTNDSTSESNETVQVTLASPVNATLGANNTHTLTIQDDDATAPTVQSLTSTLDNGSYSLGATVPIVVSFSQSVTVNTSGGTPTITLETGATDRVASYASGSGSTALTFNYTVQAGDTSADLDYTATSSLALNGGTIKDGSGNNATLTLPSPGAAGSLGANKAIAIDTTAPSAFSISGATGGTDSTADAYLTSGTTVTANWSAATGAASYDVLIRNNADNADVCAVQNTAATSYTFTGCTLTDGTSYKIKVTAKDDAGNTTAATNNAFSFAVSTSGPGAFNITGATGGSDSTANAYLSNGTTVTANWESATGAASYDVVIRNNADNANICATQNTTSTSYTFTGCTLTEDTTYKINVTAKTAAGNTTAASNNAYSFTVDTTAPSAFTITGGTGGTDITSDGYLTDGTSMTLNWNASTGASNYTILVRNEADTTTICGPLETGSAETSYELSSCTLTAGTRYRFSVTAEASNGLTKAATNAGMSIMLGSGDPDYYDEVVADSPSHYWRFNETSGISIADASGNNRGGEYSPSGIALNSPGLVPSSSDTAVEFSGTASYTELWPSTMSTTTGITVEMLFKATSLGTIETNTLATIGYQDEGVGFHWLYLFNGELCWQYAIAGDYKAKCATFTPSLNTTYHVAVTHDYAAKEIRFYLNGSLHTTITHTDDVVPVTGKYMNVGSMQSWGHYFAGTLDEPAFYLDKILSPSRISSHYSASGL